MHSSRLLAALAALVVTPCAAAAGPQSAPPPQATAKDEVVITGRTQRDRLIRDYVRALTAVPGRDPLARFDHATLCPGVVGLSPARNAEIAKRMRVVASAAGISLSKKADCRPNALVIVAADKDAMIAALKQTHPAYFRDLTGALIDPPRQPGSATAWHLENRVDRFGQRVGHNGDYFRVSTPLPSRISHTMRPIFVAAVVVIELDAVVGMTTTQLADYAAMRTFARTDPEKVKGLSAPTILSVLDAADDAEVPVTLTQWDLGYLRGLYAAAPMRSAWTQRGEIKREIASDLDEAAGGK